MRILEVDETDVSLQMLMNDVSPSIDLYITYRYWVSCRQKSC